MGALPRWLRGSCCRFCPPKATVPWVLRRDQAGVPSQSMPLLLSHCRASLDRSGGGDGLTSRPVIRTPPFAPRRNLSPRLSKSNVDRAPKGKTAPAGVSWHEKGYPYGLPLGRVLDRFTRSYWHAFCYAARGVVQLDPQQFGVRLPG